MNILVKNYIKKIIKESFIVENYPESFDMDFFKRLTNKSFKKRIEYCDQHLERITNGTSRIIYKINDEKVLKLAWNKKGLFQNETEYDYNINNIDNIDNEDIKDILAKIFDNDINYGWIEMEFAKELTPDLFKRITKFDWDSYVKLMWKYFFTVKKDSSYISFTKGQAFSQDPKIEKKMSEDDFISTMIFFLIKTDTFVRDLTKLNSYGVVKRNGQDKIVLIDYGLTSEGLNTYYN